jgi:hypothetical protein
VRAGRARAGALAFAVLLAAPYAAAQGEEDETAGEAAGEPAAGELDGEAETDETDEDAEEAEDAEDAGDLKSREALPAKDTAALLPPIVGRARFCKDDQYPLRRDELAWCEAAATPEGRRLCPALARACRRGATADEPQELKWGGLPAVPAGIRVVLWGLLVLAVGWVFLRILRQAAGDWRQRQDPATAGPRAPQVRPGPAEARAVETDVARLLEAARIAATGGRFGDAIGLAYAALLRRFEGAELVRVEPDRTNGDHLRDVGSKRPELRQRLQVVVTAVEAVEFGGERPEEHHFRFVFDRVLGLLAERLGPGPVLLALLGATLGLAGCAGSRGPEDESPSGRAAVLELLTSYGFEARQRLMGVTRLDAQVDQVVLEPDARLDAEEWQALRRWVGERGGTLIIAGIEARVPAWAGGLGSEPQPSSAPLLLTPGLVERFGPLDVVLPGNLILRARKAEPPTSPPEVPGRAIKWTPLLTRGDAPYAVEAAHAKGRIVHLADDQLLHNAALLKADNARFLTELLRMGGKRVELVSALTGLEAPNPFASVWRGRLAAVLLQLGALALLVALHKGVHFGRPADPQPPRGRPFAEHARALGGMYARARASRHALELYGAWAIERLREHVGAGRKGLSALAEALATRTGRPIGEVMRLLVEAAPRARSSTTTPTLDARRTTAGRAIAPDPADDDASTTQRRLAELLALIRQDRRRR